ncbi:MAG TPA: S9 family peptidase, partial [Methylomirabilota bacterium]|nr:S9 family peptidase [Methylomirabilota bacterium]
MRRFGCFVAVSFFLSAAPTAFAQKRPITEKDLLEFNWIGDPQVSPDDSRVVFVKVSVNEKKDGYDTSLWSVPTKGGEAPRRITSGNHDSSPRWSPDGKWLVFVRAGDSPAQPGAAASSAQQLYLLPTSGGESWRITDLPKGASGPVWSPDSKTIAFSSTTSPDDLAKKDRKSGDKAGANEPGAPERESDVRVITRSVYRINGGGYLDPKHPAHIWVLSLPQSSGETAKPRRLTSGPFSEGRIFWSRDSTRILFTTQRVSDPSYELPRTEIYSVPLAGGEPEKILTIHMGAGAMSLSQDGKRAAFCAGTEEPVRSYSQPHLWVVDLAANAQPRNITPNFDFDICSGVFGDQGTPRAGGSDEVLWSPDGSTLTTITGREGKAILVAVDVASGKMSDITRGNQAVERYRATADPSRFVVLISTPTIIGDLFVVDRAGGRTQLTRINEELFSKLNLTEPEEIWYKSFDGKKI